MPCPCRAHAVPLPCHASKGLECVFPIWFTQCGRVWFTLAMPRPCHPRPCHSSQGHGTAWTSREGLWANCPLSASYGYRSEFQEVVVRRIPISDAGGQRETKHRLSWTRKRVVAAYYQKKICYNVGLAVRIFPATLRTFTKYTALLEHGRGTAWHVWINARYGRGTAWERHAMCESALSGTRDLNHALPTLSNSVLWASCGVHSFTDTFNLLQFLLQTVKQNCSLKLYSAQILSYDTQIFRCM